MVSARNGIYYCSVFLYGVCGRVAEGACLWHMFITAGSNPVKHPKYEIYTVMIRKINGK